MFGRKAKAQELAIKALRETLAKRDQENFILQATIREMDQLIFNMGQHLSWAEMQPFYAQLKSDTDRRMREESDRIQGVLIPEMRKAYVKW